MNRSDNEQGALDLELTDKQFQAFSSDATEQLYGGAAGGAKSHLMRAALIMWCMVIPGLQCYIFRRVMDDLLKNHMDGPHGFRNLLARWVKVALCIIVEDEIRFWNGSRIKLCHCKDEKHKYNYHGAEIHVLVIDELTTFTETIYRYLRFRVRLVGLNLPEYVDLPDGKGGKWRMPVRSRFPRILCGSNPGNVGHQWVKNMFIKNGHPHGEVWQTSDDEGGMRRQYLPAKLSDNPYLERDDPDYRKRIQGLGSPQLVKAMMDGNWDVVAGAYFDEFNYDLHVLKHVQIPLNATRFRALDWGSARPFSVGWYAIVERDWPLAETMGGFMIRLPRGSLVRYREWYGIKKRADGSFEPNVGIKLTAEQLGKGICERSPKGEEYSYTVADPSTFDENGGPSIAERMRHNKVYPGMNVPCKPADNKRVRGIGAPVGGWDQVRSRLNPTDEPLSANPEPEDLPLLYFLSNNTHMIRTLPDLQHDEDNIEDINTEQEDHAGDEVRYGCMSRPRAIAPFVPAKPKSPYQFDVLTGRVDKPRSKYRN